MNLVVALLVLTGAGGAVWAGLTDPPGGLLGAVGRTLRGEPQPAPRTAPSASGLLGSAAGLAGGGGGDVAGGNAAATGTRQAVVSQGQAQLGKPYKWGGNGPASFDCSGLTVWCFKRGAGINLPRTAAQQQVSRLGRNVALGNAKPGDLIFYGAPARHVGIYIGNGQVLHAPRPGKNVMVSTVRNAGYPTKPSTCRDFLTDRPESSGGHAPDEH